MKPANQKTNVPIAISHSVQLPNLMLHKGFFIKKGTKKRKAPKTMEYVEPNIPTNG